MNVVNIVRREHTGIGTHNDVTLGTVTASPPNHAYKEAYDDYRTRAEFPVEFKTFKSLFREDAPGVKIVYLADLGIDYVLTKEKVD